MIYKRNETNLVLTPHFKACEFFCKCGKCEEQIIDDKLVDKLERLRNSLNLPIKLNCGFRCAAHNKMVGGEVNSQHLLGKAADISVEFLTLERMKEEAEKVGFNGIGLYDTFIHVDVREEPTTWDRRTK
jgi:uncharacterized protein YcbK (DUF882 family)